MKKIILITAILGLSICSAQKWQKNKINGNGNRVTQTRSTTNYDEISTGGSFSIELVAGTEGIITLQGDENLLNFIITEVENSKLKVYFKKGTWFDNNGEKIKVTIPLEKISLLNFGGSGTITTKNSIISDELELHLSGSGNTNIDVNTKKLTAVLSGSGNLKVNGSSIDTDVILSGSGRIDCSKLLCENASASISGSGNIEVNPTKTLDAKLSGSGNIYYSGDPEKVDKKVSGSGNIKKK